MVRVSTLILFKAFSDLAEYEWQDADDGHERTHPDSFLRQFASDLLHVGLRALAKEHPAQECNIISPQSQTIPGKQTNVGASR